MDILDDIFNTLNLKGVFYFRTNFSPPWGVEVPKHQQAARFHFVIQGQCYVHITGMPHPIELNPGDLILIPRGSQHKLSSAPYQPATKLETLLQDVQYSGEGVLTLAGGNTQATTQLACGHYSFRNSAEHPILQALPRYLFTSKNARKEQPLLNHLLSLLTEEVFTDKLGSSASITRLSEIVLIELLRCGIHQEPELQAILTALRDPKISQSLQLIHQNYSQQWTVEHLASAVAMSRSRFANRFRELLGTSPMTYLADWRLQKSLILLERSQLTVQQIAGQAGYQSPAAFSRAFANKFGTAPSDYRRISS